MLRIGRQEPQTGELVDGGVLEQSKLRICDTGSGNHLHIHLNALTGVGHLLIKLWFVCFFRLFWRKHTHFTHNTEQALRTMGVGPLPQPVPQLDHAEVRISAAHVANEFQLGLRVLVWMAVGASGLWQARDATLPFQRCFQKKMYDRLLLYFRLARLTPYFSVYFIRDCR